jgi:hypothetical protein
MSCVVLQSKSNPRVFGMVSSNTIQNTISIPTLFEGGTTIEELKEHYTESGNREIAKELDNYITADAFWQLAD